MIGAFAVYVLAFEQGIPMWGALILAMILTGLAAAAGIERTSIRPFDPSDHLPLVITTLGLSLAINSVAGIVWRFNFREFPIGQGHSRLSRVS